MGPASSRANNTSKTADVRANWTSVADLFAKETSCIEGSDGGSGYHSATILEQ